MIIHRGSSIPRSESIQGSIEGVGIGSELFNKNLESGFGRLSDVDVRVRLLRSDQWEPGDGS